jgi:hypothetical protein
MIAAVATGERTTRIPEKEKIVPRTFRNPTLISHPSLLQVLRADHENISVAVALRAE